MLIRSLALMSLLMGTAYAGPVQVTLHETAYSEPSQVYADILPVLQQYSVESVKICVNSRCEHFETPLVRKGGTPEAVLLPKRPGEGNEVGGGSSTAGSVVTGIVNGISSQIGMGGRVTVSYDNEKKNKDGSSEKTAIKVEVSAGTGAGAAAAASN